MQETEKSEKVESTLSKPDELFSGEREQLPTKEYVFKTPAGRRKNVLLQGLPYAVKSEIDARARLDREEAEKKGQVALELRAPMIVVAAMRNPDGSRAYTTYENQLVAAIKLRDHFADGVVFDAFTEVLKLSGHGDEALDEAGKD